MHSMRDSILLTVLACAAQLYDQSPYPYKEQLALARMMLLAQAQMQEYP